MSNDIDLTDDSDDDEFQHPDPDDRFLGYSAGDTVRIYNPITGTYTTATVKGFKVKNGELEFIVVNTGGPAALRIEPKHIHEHDI